MIFCWPFGIIWKWLPKIWPKILISNDFAPDFKPLLVIWFKARPYFLYFGLFKIFERRKKFWVIINSNDSRICSPQTTQPPPPTFEPHPSSLNPNFQAIVLLLQDQKVETQTKDPHHKYLPTQPGTRRIRPLLKHLRWQVQDPDSLFPGLLCLGMLHLQ